MRLDLKLDDQADCVVFIGEDGKTLHDDTGPLVAIRREELEDNSYKFKWRDRVVHAALTAGGKEA